MEQLLAGECLQGVEIAHRTLTPRSVADALFKRRAKPTRERLWLTVMEPSAERERAPPQLLTHPRGKTIDLPDVRAHRSQIAAGSQRCRQDDEIVVISQFCLQPLQFGNQWSDAGGERLGQTRIPVGPLHESQRRVVARVETLRPKAKIDDAPQPRLQRWEAPAATDSRISQGPGLAGRRGKR
jgi:hypothetical protein